MAKLMRDEAAIFVFIGLLFLLVGIANASGTTRQSKLFEIERSKNANVVRYDVQVLADGTADPSEPVVGYWVKPSGKTKPIKAIQKQAYGFTAEYDGETDTIRINMTPNIGRAIHAARVEGEYRAMCRIDGEDAYVTRIYVKSEERKWWPIPKVLHIDFEGSDVKTGARRSERFVP